MSPDAVKEALSESYYAARQRAKSEGVPFFLTIAQFGRIGPFCVDPARSSQPSLEEYLASQPEGSPFPTLMSAPAAKQITSKTLFWDYPDTSPAVSDTSSAASPAVSDTPPASPPVVHPRLRAYYATLRHRLDGSGIPFRMSIDDLGRVPHRLRGATFPLRHGLLTMPAHYLPIVTTLQPSRGFVPGNLVWEANGYVEA